MIITAQQAAEKLGFRRTSPVRRLVREGKLTPVNSPKPGAKKFFMKFRVKDVNELKKTLVVPRRRTLVPRPTLGLFSQLERIVEGLGRLEQKVDHLTQIWS